MSSALQLAQQIQVFNNKQEKFMEGLQQMLGDGRVNSLQLASATGLQVAHALQGQVTSLVVPRSREISAGSLGFDAQNQIGLSEEDKFLVTANNSVGEIWQEFAVSGPSGKPPIVKLMAFFGKEKWFLNTGKEDNIGRNNRKNIWWRRNLPIVSEVIWAIRRSGMSAVEAVKNVEEMQKSLEQNSIDGFAKLLRFGKKGGEALGVCVLKKIEVEKLIENFVENKRMECGFGNNKKRNREVVLGR